MLFDVTRLADRLLQNRLPTGVDRVSLAYLEHFGHRASALIRFGGRWVELSYANSQQLFTALIHHDHTSATRIRWLAAKSYLTTWQQSPASVFFNTGHSGLDLLDYPFKINRRGLLPIYFLHDLIPISHPEYCRPGEAEKHHRRLNAMLSTGKGLIANSQATLDDLSIYATEQQQTLPPCVVAPLAPGQLPTPSTQRPLDAPYFVVLGTIEPRKNHLLLLHTWRALQQELGEHTPKLVIVGQRGWECEQVIDLLDRCKVLHGIVLEKTGCSDTELATWLFHGQALLFPSFIEGFGMPLVEALMLKLPVIASNLSVFKEIAGDIPTYLDPLDGMGWLATIKAFMDKDYAERVRQIKQMENYRPTSWQEHFIRVDDFLQTIIPNYG